MNEKLDGIRAIKPAENDALYRRGGREAPRQSNFNGVLVFVVLLMAIVMGVGGYTIYEVQLKLDQSNMLLAKGQENIKALEDRLAATGTDVSKTLQDMKREIGDNFKQIDLLWGHAYRTNKPNIEANREAIARIRSDIDDQLSPSVVKLEQGFSALSKDVSEAKLTLQADTEEMTTQVALLRGQVQDQAVTVEGNRRNLNALTKQVRDAQEAIDVIDQYRRQINQRIVDLQNQIQAKATR